MRQRSYWKKPLKLKVALELGTLTKSLDEIDRLVLIDRNCRTGQHPRQMVFDVDAAPQPARYIFKALWSSI